MTDPITSAPAGKRGRNGSVILTDRMCEKRVTQRVKIYDRKCPGLYVSITSAGVATFSVKFTDPATGKQRTGWLGVYNPETFTVEDARSKVYGLKGKGAAAPPRLSATTRSQAQARYDGRSGSSSSVEWMKTPVMKPDGEMRPRIESWENVGATCDASSAHGLARSSPAKSPKTTLPALQRHRRRQVRQALDGQRPPHAPRGFGVFNWAAEAGRDYVTASPCVNLPQLDEEHPRDRVLCEDEIRTLWHGLDREDMPWDRTTRLAIKFALASMLRSAELLGSIATNSMPETSPSIFRHGGSSGGA